ncbi:MAG TPA: S1 RNA-binding domain-containing protein [Patescibacteria group bacterium]|nr:S1 RNA-binding domain-containing protein [Patescibacteria group bacterium]
MVLKISKVKSQISKNNIPQTTSNHSLIGSKGGQATTMAELMARQTTAPTTLKKGDEVKGVITKVSKQEILLDIQGKAEAVILERDKRLFRSLLLAIKEGDHVLGTVISVESETGSPLISLRRFMEEKGWQKLMEAQKNQEALDAVVTEVTKGGLVVAVDTGLSGFLPNSHMLSSGSGVVGETITVYVLETQRAENKIVFSQRKSVGEEEFAKSTQIFKVGSKVKGVVTTITTFGVFVTVQTEGIAIDGLIHVSEIAWEKVIEFAGDFTVGQELEAVVIGVDKEAKRLDLSLKRLSEDPFAKISLKFPVETKVKGIVTKLSGGTVYIDLGEGIEGIIRKEKIPPTLTFKTGDSVTATVTEIDARRHKILLTPVLLDKPIGYR